MIYLCSSDTVFVFLKLKSLNELVSGFLAVHEACWDGVGRKDLVSGQKHRRQHLFNCSCTLEGVRLRNT